MAQFRIKEGNGNPWDSFIEWNGREWNTNAECFGGAIVFLFGVHRSDTRFLPDHPDSNANCKVYSVEGSPRKYKITKMTE